MKQGRWTQILIYLLAAALLVAGFLKWQNVTEFESALKSFHLLPESMLAFTSAWIPAVELLIGILLVSGLWRSTALLGATLLCLSFTAVLGWALWKGYSGSCGCFGAWDPLAHHPWLSLARAAAMFCLSAGLYCILLAGERSRV